MKKLVVVALLLAAMFGLPARAADLGDKAPELAVSEWAKGQPVTLAALKEQKKVVIVEFWATWCPPCRASIPHLTELQKKYAETAVFIGISSEEAATVRPFVEKQGDQMEYRVAVDNDGKTNKAYMEAYGIDGIPHAFLVDREGRVVFHAHPMDPKFEETLKAVLDGTFDLEKARATLASEHKLEQLLEQYGELVMEGTDKEKAKEVSKELYGAIRDDGEKLNQLAWAIASATELGFQDLDFALQCAARAVELTGEKEADALDTLARVQYEQGDKEKAIATAEKALQLTEDEELREHIEFQLKVYRGEETTEDEGEEVEEVEQVETPGQG
ncbi:MAG: redoxin family protein [Candidatus Hydrogenedentes bacterium]|nr:redoxin family protein [Candidatus Hydrogenedentota bacterium]